MRPIREERKQPGSGGIRHKNDSGEKDSNGKPTVDNSLATGNDSQLTETERRMSGACREQYLEFLKFHKPGVTKFTKEELEELKVHFKKGAKKQKIVMTNENGSR